MGLLFYFDSGLQFLFSVIAIEYLQGLACRILAFLPFACASKRTGIGRL
jgi:hypothetical protein